MKRTKIQVMCLSCLGKGELCHVCLNTGLVWLDGVPDLEYDDEPRTILRGNSGTFRSYLPTFDVDSNSGPWYMVASI